MTDNVLSSAVSVVIPSFNAQQLLEKNLPLVVKCLRAGDEVVVVDDASSDESVSWLVKTYDLKPIPFSPEFDQYQGEVERDQQKIMMTVVSNHQNLRFGAAANRGVSVAQHALVFLLNNDVKPHADVLKYLLPHFNDSTMFAVGCLEHEEHNLNQLGGKNKLWFEKGMFVHSRADDYESGETAWASGGSAVFDKAKWLELGGFDPLFYPAYWEDVDLSFRAKQRGWKVWFEARAEVDHHHESTNQDVFGQQRINRMSWQNAIKFTWRHANWWQKLEFLAWQPYYWWVMRKSLSGGR